MTWGELRSSYDRVARKYEARFLDELDGKPRDRELLDAFARAVTDSVVEIGCGPGQVGAYVRSCGRRVVGLDLSAEMAQLARGRLDGALSADMRALPVASASAGGVLAFYSLIHVPRPGIGAALDEFRRVLRPGGRLLLSAHEGDGEYVADKFLDEAVPFIATFFSLDELAAAVDGAGLDVTLAERRESYATESGTIRLFIEAVRPG